MKRLIIILTVLITLCGCSSFGRSNITSLLSSPKHSQTESLIAQEIGDYLGENITLKYSQTLGYSAPIQFIDIDGDETEEALVFYYALNKGPNIRFALLKYEDERWNIVFDKEGLGSEVFCFDTIQLQGLEGKQIITGYLPSNINENFFVTYFTDASVQTEDYVEVCRDFSVGEVTGDGYDDIILTSDISDGRIRIKALSFTAENGFKTAGSKVLRYRDIDVTQIAVSHTADGEPAIYVDYTDSYNRMYTEAGVIYNNAIVNCLSEDYLSRSWGYSSKLNSFDIDGDGVQEIPTVIQDETSEELPVLRFVEWSDYTQQQPVRKFWGVYDTSENIFFALPDEWQNLVNTEYSVDLWKLLADGGETVIMELSKAEDKQLAQSGYSYTVDIGDDVWNIWFDESVDTLQTEYILQSVTAFS